MGIADVLGPDQRASSSVLQWFAAPELPRPDLRRHARALWLVSWPFFAVIVAMLAIGVVIEPETLARRATTVAAVGVLITVLHSISRAGRPVLASWLLVLGLSAIVTQRAWITGGIHAPVAVFYVLFIVMSGVLIGVRGGMVTAAACVLGATVLALGTAFHWLAAPAAAGSPLSGFVFVMLAIGVALVIHAPLNVGAGRGVDGLDTMRMLVHDMRSPLQIVLAHLDLLREDIRGDARATDVEEAIGGALVLRRMTDSLLDASRLESGRMPIQPSDTDLMTLARSVVESLRVLQPSRTVTIEGSVAVPCRCDVELTRRVIDNLVGNAMKHTEIAGRVRVVVTRTDDKARLEVHDEGTGVPQEKRGALFAPYRTTSPASPAGCASSGLGLAFCKLAVEVQGARFASRTPCRTAACSSSSCHSGPAAPTSRNNGFRQAAATERRRKPKSVNTKPTKANRLRSTVDVSQTGCRRRRRRWGAGRRGIEKGLIHRRRPFSIP